MDKADLLSKHMVMCVLLRMCRTRDAARIPDRIILISMYTGLSHVADTNQQISYFHHITVFEALFHSTAIRELC